MKRAGAIALLMTPALMWQAYAQPGNLVLQDTTIATAATFAATNSITAGPNFTIAGTGDVTFVTSGYIYFRSGVVMAQGGRFRAIGDSTFVGVTMPSTPTLPAEFSLQQNYPNPFNPATTFAFDLPRTAHVVLVVHNMLGQTVATVVNENLAAGSYSRTFNAGGLASGVYFYRLTAKGYSESRRMLLMK